MCGAGSSRSRRSPRSPPDARAWQSFKERTTRSARLALRLGLRRPEGRREVRPRPRQLFAEGSYDKAREIFRDLADNQRNSTDLAERARFMQAECRYQRGQYPEAVDTYHKLLMDFPTGAHRRECCSRMFEISDYWLNDFRDELDRRADETGVLRWRPGWPNPFDERGRSSTRRGGRSKRSTTSGPTT